VRSTADAAVSRRYRQITHVAPVIAVTPSPTPAGTLTHRETRKDEITDCFGKIDHDILIGILAEHIHDNRFLRLIRNMLKAGYLDDWVYHETLSGTPQGGLCSAEHNPPYEQCGIMRNAVLMSLVRAMTGIDRCA
jgi:hypothetical protein